MKILFISENYPPYVEGGAEISTSLLANWLARENAVSIACCDFAEKSWTDENGVTVFPIITKASLGTKSILSAFKYAIAIIVAPIASSIRIIRLIKKSNPDVVNIVVTLYYFAPIVLAVRFFSRRPVFIDCRDHSLICPSQFKNNEIKDPLKTNHGYRCLKGYQTANKFLTLFTPPFALYESLIFNLYKSSLRCAVNKFRGIRLVSLSNYVKQQLIMNGFAEEKITVIPNISERRAMANVKKSVIPTFTFGGRIEQEKGIWDLMDAAEILHDEFNQSFLLNIAGIGSELDAVRDYVKGKGLAYIRVLGYLKSSEVLFLYQQSLAIMAPVRWPEPFGRFIQESISTGTPAIASATGGIPEGIKDQITGVLIHPRNPKELAVAMKYFIENPEKSTAMGSAIMEQWPQYSADKIGKERLRLYGSFSL